MTTPPRSTSVPVEADRKPRQLRTARTAYFEHLLSHTVQANFSGPFWPFVYLFASDGLEKDAARDSGFTRIAEPTLTLAPETFYTSAGNDLIVIGGQKPLHGPHLQRGGRGDRELYGQSTVQRGPLHPAVQSG